MKRIATLFCLPAGLLLNIQAHAQETFDATITASGTQPEKTGRRFGRSWMQQQRERRENRANRIPGSMISAESDAQQAADDYQELPEDVWTPLHQQIYNDILSGKIAAALQSVLRLKKEGGSVDVAVPHDIRRRTLHAVAFDISRKFFNGSLELRPEWPNLISELQDEN